jgi:excisionase family DNA binding protein
MNHLHKAGSPEAPTQINISRHHGSRPMDATEAAEYLGLEPRLIRDWARKGYLPAHPLGEGKRRIWRFLEHELMDWLNSHTNSADRR